MKGYKDEIKIDWNIIAFNSNIIKNGEVAANIRRKLTFMLDALELGASEGEMQFMLALVAAINSIRKKNKIIKIKRRINYEKEKLDFCDSFDAFHFTLHGFVVCV